MAAGCLAELSAYYDLGPEGLLLAPIVTLLSTTTELSEIKEAGSREEVHSLNIFTISFFSISSVPNIVLGPGRPGATVILMEVIREAARWRWGG